MSRRSKIAPFHHLVGTVPDREIGIMAGTSIATVCHYRQKHNIPSYRSTLALGAEKPVGSNLNPGGTCGYTATIAGPSGPRTVVVLAEGMMDAIQQAGQLGEVQGVAYIGPLLGAARAEKPHAA